MGSWIPILLFGLAFLLAADACHDLWRDRKRRRARNAALARSIASRFERKGYTQ